jgi:hypothetical protein
MLVVGMRVDADKGPGPQGQDGESSIRQGRSILHSAP